MQAQPTRKKPTKRITRERQARALEASKVASVRAARRRKVYEGTLYRMAVAGLTLGDMARQLEEDEILTPRGNWWWSRQQVRATLRFALRGAPKELIAAYLPKVGTARKVGWPMRKSDKRKQRNISHRKSEDPYIPLDRERIRSRIRKRPA